MNNNKILKDKIEAMKVLDLFHSDKDKVVWEVCRIAARVKEMTVTRIYDITKDLDNLAQRMDRDTPLGVCKFLKYPGNWVFYTMWANSDAFIQYIAEKPLINLLKKLRDRLITITKWWERYGDEIYIKCINEPEDKTLPSAIDRFELGNNYKVAREWLEIIEFANIPVPDKPEGIKPMTHTLPAELDSERARRYFSRAVEAGLMSEQFEWKASKALLAYFCHDMSLKLDLGKGYNSNNTKRLCWKPFEALFNQPNLRASLNSLQQTGSDPIDVEKLNSIFKD